MNQSDRHVACLLVFLLAGMAGAGWYFATDDHEVLISTEVAEYAPTPEGGEETYRKLLAITREVGRPALYGALETGGDPAAFLESLELHQADINRQYREIQALFPKVTELASYPAIGDPTDCSWYKVVPYAGLQGMTRILASKVELAALGEPDPEAVQMLCNWMRILQAWSPHTRPLAHSMMATVTYGNCLKSINRSWDFLTENERQMIHDVVESSPDFTESVAQSVMVEYCYIGRELNRYRAEELSDPLRLLLNRNHTLNNLGAYLSGYVELSRSGDFAGAQALSEQFERELGQERLKNFIGWQFLKGATPAVGKVYHTALSNDRLKEDVLLRLRSSID